jgi:alkylation response protein AidB-like acyl-CoA dehydrogenase
MANRFARECLEESITYARTRKTFGKRLIDHQVIRHKIAEMASRVEGCQLQLENIVRCAWLSQLGLRLYHLFLPCHFFVQANHTLPRFGPTADFLPACVW